MNFNKLYESLLEEGLSDKLFYTRSIESLFSIIRDNRFKLSPIIRETTRDKELNLGRNYYLSTARTRTSSYRLDNTHKGVLIELDGVKLRQRYKGNSVDFFAGFRGQSVEKRNNYEQEDRVVSDSEFMPNAISYITRVDIYERDFRPSDAQLKFMLSKLSVPIYWYKNEQDWIVGASHKAINLQDLR
jgi:hypothetical protein